MRPTDHEEAAQNIQAQRHEAFFPRVWVVSGKSVGILKHGGCVCEVDRCFFRSAAALSGSHWYVTPNIVCTSVHGARQSSRSRGHLTIRPPCCSWDLCRVINHQLALGRFLKCRVVPIDNGIVEQLHVRAAIARKTLLHAGSDAGGERAGIVLTTLACCRLTPLSA